MDCTLASWCMIDHLLKLCRQEGCKFCISSLASDGEREKFLLSLSVFWSVWCSPHPREFLVPARRTQRPAQRPQCAERNWNRIAKAINETFNPLSPEGGCNYTPPFGKSKIFWLGVCIFFLTFYEFSSWNL